MRTIQNSVETLGNPPRKIWNSRGRTAGEQCSRRSQRANRGLQGICANQRNAFESACRSANGWDANSRQTHARLHDEDCAREISNKTTHSNETYAAEKKKGRRFAPAQRCGRSAQNENLSPN